MLSDGVVKLKNIKKTAYETENIAIDVEKDLHEQNERMK